MGRRKDSRSGLKKGIIKILMKKIVKNEELQGKMGIKDRLRNASLRAQASFAPHGGVVTRGELDASQKATVVIGEAQKEAEAIRQEAEKILSQVESERDRARKEGFQKGREEGLAEVTEELVKARVLKEKFFAENESEVLRLVMAMAEKVIGQTVQTHADAFRSVVKQALEHSIGDRIVVRLNPADLARIRAEDTTFKSILDRTKQLYFKEDGAIGVGGCVVETEIGTIDAQLETQLKAIKKALNL